MTKLNTEHFNDVSLIAIIECNSNSPWISSKCFFCEKSKLSVVLTKSDNNGFVHWGIKNNILYLIK